MVIHRRISARRRAQCIGNATDGNIGKDASHAVEAIDPMDQCVVDLGRDSQAQAGDYVTVMGGDGYSIDEWAAAARTINYEIVTRIAPRVPRIY